MVTKIYRGSRKHVLDWTGKPSFLRDLEELLKPVQIQVSLATPFMPCGYKAPKEARLETFGRDCIKNDTWEMLQEWWLVHTQGANTPNWDIAVYCLIDGRPGFVLVEAKANRRELKTNGKYLASDAFSNSCENHQQIGKAIEEACLGWRCLDPTVSINRDSHYQLANRLAFTWKIAMLGFPVVLVYLGFTGDNGIRDVGDPFSDDRNWQSAFASYIDRTFPIELFEQPLDLRPARVWLLSRSRPIIEVSPQRIPRDTAFGRVV
jgi:hypothetical protein